MVCEQLFTVLKIKKSAIKSFFTVPGNEHCVWVSLKTVKLPLSLNSQFFLQKDEHLSFLKKSLFEIGMYYYRAKDKLATAIYYLYQAGLAGAALGWYNLGVLVRKEFKDDVLASEYFLKAANLGCHRSDFNLAWLGLAEK